MNRALLAGSITLGVAVLPVCLIVSGAPLFPAQTATPPAPAAAAVAVGSQAPSSGTKHTTSTPAGTDTIIVRLSARAADPVRTAKRAVSDAAAGLAGVKTARLIGTDIVSVTLDRPVSAAAAAKLTKAAAAHPGVAAVDRSLTFVPAGSSTVQNYQWNLAGTYGVNAADAWDTTTGRGVVVGVVDTGMASNRALPAATTTRVTAANSTSVVGTTAPGLPVTVATAADSSACTTAADAAGAFTCRVPGGSQKWRDNDLLTVTATDGVGRTSITKWVVGDATAPEPPAINPSNGTSFSGTAEPGATVTLTYPDHSTQDATVGADGTWLVAEPTFHDFSDGDTVSAVATDPNGNVSAPGTRTIDKVAPDAPVLEPTQGDVVKGTREAHGSVRIEWTSDSGEHHSLLLDSGSDTTWTAALVPSAKDGTTISATVTDPAGNVSAAGTVKADQTPPAPAQVARSDGRTVRISGVEDGAAPSMVEPTGAKVAGEWTDDGAGEWTFKPAVDLTEADAVDVVLTDKAGNSSDPVRVVVDTTPPDSPVVYPTSGRVVSGTAEPDSTITLTYYRHGTRIRTTAATAEDGTWTASLNPVAANGRTIGAAATDTVGNTSGVTTVTVDAAPPSSPTIAPSDGRSVAVTGVESGATPSLVDEQDAAIAGEWTDAGDGGWTFTPAVPLGEEPAVFVVVTDAADNTSVPVQVSVDTTPPDAPAIEAVTAAAVSGTAEADSSVRVTYRDEQDGEHTTPAVVAAADGSWAVVLDPEAAPGTDLSATATDAVGHTSDPTTVPVPAPSPSPSPSPTASADPEPGGDPAPASSGGGAVISAAEASAGPSVPDTTVDNGTNMVGTVLPGYDFVDNDDRPSDSASTSHGTHVAGIIAATGLDSSPAGVAPAVQIEPLRALDSNATDSSPNNMQNVIDAIYWGAGIPVGNRPVNPHPVNVLNLSIATSPLAGATCPDTLQTAINAAVRAGVVVVAAAGNGNSSISTTVPANCANVIVVTATTATGARAAYSNWGTSTTSASWLVAAPGGSGDNMSACGLGCTSGVISTIAGNGLQAKAGTSMSAPHVAAVAALVKAVKPALLPADIARIIRGTAASPSDGCPTAVCGAGIVDARAAVRAARDSTPVSLAGAASARLTLTVAAGAAVAGGSAQVGTALTALATSSYSSLNYQWLRNGTVLLGTTPYYQVTGADYGSVITVRVATSIGGSSLTSGSIAVNARALLTQMKKPAATGTYKVKKTLKASIGAWAPVTPTSVSYQWYRSGKKIKKATKATYKLTKSDRGKTVKVKVTVSAAGYYTASAYSASHKIKR